MHFISVSFTHKNTDVELRERLSFAQSERKREVLRLIGANERVRECMAISTCNRVEIFAAVSEADGVFAHILNAISIITLIPFDALEFRADFYEDQSAIHHLFAVASSLDSLVVGETQITGQLKADFKFAYECGNAGEEIASAVHFALKCAARVRSLAGFGRGAVSVASVAVAKAREVVAEWGASFAGVGGGMNSVIASGVGFCGANSNLAQNGGGANSSNSNLGAAGENSHAGANGTNPHAGANGANPHAHADSHAALRGITAAVVGSGEMSRLCAKHLCHAGAHVIVCARNHATGAALAGEVGGEFADISQLSRVANSAPLLFSATGASEPLLTNANVRACGLRRAFFDLAIPRDIAVNCDEVAVFAVDDLQGAAEQNIALREEQANAAYRIVGECVVEFGAHRAAFYAAPAIRALRASAKQIAQRELQIALKKGYIRHCDSGEVERILHQAFRAFLHMPSVKLKEKNDKNTLRTLGFLFGFAADGDGDGADFDGGDVSGEE